MKMSRNGTRDDLVTELQSQAEGWSHLAKDKLSEDAARGADDLSAGASSVQVGHTVYRVTDS